MEIQLATQYVLDNKSIVYDYADDILHVTMTFNDEVYEDSFDFSSFSEDGILLMFDEFGESTIQADLPINPIVSVERVGGVLHLTILEWVPDKTQGALAADTEEVEDIGKD